MFDNVGYLRLTDFGVACMARPDNSAETSGTPGYMAPEVMMRKSHDIAADYFAVGVIAYECMLGKRPYVGKSRREIRDAVISRQAQVKRFEIPEGWSEDSADFINACLQRNPLERIGSQTGVNQLKQHKWFNGFDWQALEEKTMESPFIPDIRVDNFDANHVNNTEWKDAEAVKENEQQLRRDSVQKLFEGYYYDKTDSKPLMAPVANTTKVTTGGNTEAHEA